MKVMTRNTVSTANLLKSVFKEEGIDLTAFRAQKKKQLQKEGQEGNFFTKTYKLVSTFFKWWFEKTAAVAYIFLVFWLLASVLSLFIAGIDLIPGVDLETNGVALVEILYPSAIVMTLLVMMCAIVYRFFKGKSDEDATLSNSKENVQNIFLSLNSYIEEKRKEATGKISQKKSELETEHSLIQSEIKSKTKLIESEKASGILKQGLIQDKKILETQEGKLSNKIQDLKTLQKGVDEGIDFLIDKSSPQVSWNLRAFESRQRTKERWLESEIKLEESQQLIDDTIRDFARFWGLMTGKLEQINSISGAELADSKEVLDVSKLEEFLSEEDPEEVAA